MIVPTAAMSTTVPVLLQVTSNVQTSIALRHGEDVMEMPIAMTSQMRLIVLIVLRISSSVNTQVHI